MNPKLKNPVIYFLRCRPGVDDDLIAWLNGLPDQPFGIKSHSVKTALRRGLQGTGPFSQETPALDVGELRQVVEAAVATQLARCGATVFTADAVESPESGEAEALLDQLTAGMAIDE